MSIPPAKSPVSQFTQPGPPIQLNPLSQGQTQFGQLAELPYEQQLQVFLYHGILSKFIKDPELRKLYITDDKMQIWYQAFTDKSASPLNYDRLEKFGDAVLKSQFVRYLMERFTNVSEDALNAFQDRYMSKDPQRDYTIMLGFYKFIIFEQDLVLSRDMLEDVFESFTGALARISDLIQEGQSGVDVFNFLQWLFTLVTIDESLVYGRPRSQVKEIYEMLRWVEVTDKVEGPVGYQRTTVLPSLTGGKGHGRTQVLVVLTQRAVDYLKLMEQEEGKLYLQPLSREYVRTKYGMEHVIGSGEGPSKDKATKLAYQEAMERLAAIGLTKELVQQRLVQLDFQSPLIEPIINDVLRKIETDQLQRIYFEDETKFSRNGRLVQLFGLTKDGETKILTYTVSLEKRLPIVKAKLLEAYVTTSFNDLPLKVSIPPST